MAKPVLTTLKVMPIPEGVAIPFYTQHLAEDGTFNPGEKADKSATTLLDELLRWTTALASLRQ